MKIAYLRVSTEEQNLHRQFDALSDVCDQVYCERLSGVATKRPVFDKVMNLLKPGDTLVVWDLDRAFRSTGTLPSDPVLDLARFTDLS